ncbi:SH3 domain-containing protein [Ancylobacter sp. WKF20]|uniref:SH3 domain-containing protein n=1 Tax=Ancylobacter sp. WKF20 TaxID=3039801 RepID=UPI002434545C|nr:SH3 domain-containing protein [Ancylobacter sp. WKF20]WGD31589.1 SH3 domain-containing protein [Ancylobacter sp. WKF20]
MHFAKSLMVAAGLLMAGTVAASARPAVATTDLNIRSGPGTRYAVIGSLPAGTQVNTGGCAGSWCRVGGGFVSASYLAFGGRAPARVVVQPNYYANDVALGVGAFALGAAVGSAWGGPGYGPYWGPGPGYWGGPRYYGYGPRYYGPRRGYWGGGPGWRGRGPVYYRGGVSGWRGGGADWRGRGRGPVFR